jgi:hypothetical protein
MWRKSDGPQRNRLREVAILAAASPMIAELLSSSAPPLQFFIPWVFTLFVTFYGGAAILIRELTLRRGSGWRGVLLQGAAFAVLEEGLSAKVFFDPASRSLGPLAEHGRWFGINVIWTLDGLAYHAVFSIALPILLVYQIKPDSSGTNWLGRTGRWVTGIIFGLSAWVFLAHSRPYEVPAAYQAACWAVIAGLVWGGLRKPAVRPRRPAGPPVPPKRFLVLGFFATLGLILQIYVVPSLVVSPWITLAIAVGGGIGVAWRLVTWTGHGANWGRPQQSGLVIGAVGCLAVLALFHEINPTRTYDATGMSVVGLAALLGLWALWKRTVALPNG